MKFQLGWVVALMLIAAAALCGFGLLQPGFTTDPAAQVRVGYIAAGIIALGMVGYAAVLFASRRVSRARLDASTYPADVEDVPPSDPLPEPLLEVDALLRRAGFVIDSERRGLHSADGSPTLAWHYHNPASTVLALIALSADQKEVGILLTSYLRDETQLTTRLSRTLPTIQGPGYESHSVEKPGEIVEAHNKHLQRLVALHGEPIAIVAPQDEHQLAAKYYTRNMDTMFDAMWRRNLIWVAIVEGIGLVALAAGLIQLANPAVPPVKGLAVLIGAAVLLGTLTLSAAASLLRAGQVARE